MADDLAGYLAGIVLECEDVPRKDKLRQMKVDVGQGGPPLTIVTNASNVKPGVRVVIATVGAALKGGETVTKATVGGVTSEGMCCDAPMLGWVGGGAGAAALLPDTFAPGDAPPTSRPRLDGGDGGGGGSGGGGGGEAKSTGPGVDTLFEKKLTKEEKKAAAEKKKAERAAKKSTKGGENDEAGGDEP
mmetsp:Transcript_36580/g.91163  ORF Transcript_36580/g.91163 Transcript_36580/m.91163 type:complete len:188 (-) Transcript_36580:214-777(-)